MTTSFQPLVDTDVDTDVSATRPAPQRPASAARVRIRLWDLPTRLFHWSLVAAVLVAVVTGQIGGDWMRVHGRAGLAIVGLVVFRLIWGFVGATHARFASFAPTPRKIGAYLKGRWQGVGHNPLGALSVLVLLGLLALQSGSGLFSNDDISFSGPLAALVSDALSSRLTALHHRLADVLLILIGLHVLAILFYAWFKKDNLVKPMVTGYKEVESGESTRKGGWMAFAIAVVAALAAVYLASGASLRAPPEVQETTQPAVSPAW